MHDVRRFASSNEQIQLLSQRNINARNPAPSPCGKDMTKEITLPRFHVAVINNQRLCENAASSSNNNNSSNILPSPKSIRGKLLVFYLATFTGDNNKSRDSNNVPKRTKNSIRNTVNHPTSVHIVLYALQTNRADPKKGTQFTVIAVISIVPRHNLSFLIPLCAVTAQDYSNEFGSKNDGNPFRRRGIMTMLIDFASVLVRSSYPNAKSNHQSISALPMRNDPYKDLFFRKLGFVFNSYTTKSVFSQQLVDPTTGDHLPFSGNEIVYLKTGQFQGLCGK